MRQAICSCAVAAAVLVAGAAAAASPSPIAAKRAQARQVLAQIDVIDQRLAVVTEQFDGARVRLTQIKAQLRVAHARLARARAQNTRAQLAKAKLLVQLYTSDRPTTLDVLLGVHSLSDLLSLSDAERAISRQVASVADAATRARERLQLRVSQVQEDERASQVTVQQLASTRAQIERGLAQRRTLLTSVQAEITRMVAAQRARQERLAAEARARLAAEAAARARAEAAAAARARAAAAAAAAAERARAAAAQRAKAHAAAAAAAAAASAKAKTTTAATTTPVASDPPPAPTTTAAAVLAPPPTQTFTQPLTVPPAAPVASPAPLVGGHPQAAQIVLQYIGVPYLWGGSTPAGFDCSGLVSYVFAQLGVTLPHYAADQYTYGVAVPQSQLQPGDLVFFDALNHVGIYIGNGQYVDAPDTGSFVRIDSLTDSWAIANYVGARRV